MQFKLIMLTRTQLLWGKQQGLFPQYKLLSSVDGINWKLLLDKSENKTDVPHDYIELNKPAPNALYKIQKYSCGFRKILPLSGSCFRKWKWSKA